MPAIMNAANEVAVEAFLGGKIGFMDIAEVIERTIQGLGEPRGGLGRGHPGRGREGEKICGGLR